MAKESENIPVKSGGESQMSHPLSSLRQDIDRIFDSFMSGWPRFGRMMDREPFANFPRSRFALSPSVDVSETDGGYEITAELPGIDEKNIEVAIANSMLTLKGEKQEEREEKKKDYHVSERSYGSFQRSFRVPDDVDAGRIDCKFSKGVLKINMPKSAEAKANTRKIEVKAG
jgi:HSP20 family protein